MLSIIIIHKSMFVYMLKWVLWIFGFSIHKKIPKNKIKIGHSLQFYKNICVPKKDLKENSHVQNCLLKETYFVDVYNMKILLFLNFFASKYKPSTPKVMQEK